MRGEKDKRIKVFDSKEKTGQEASQPNCSAEPKT
jgi:hypothetical protein